MKILVVDDSQLVLQFTRDALQAKGHEVHTSADIFIASAVNRIQPDLILMDVTVSTQSGPVAVETLKKRGFVKNCVVLLYSGMPEKQLAELALSCGADGFVVKSKDPEELYTRVLKALEKVAQPA